MADIYDKATSNAIEAPTKVDPFEPRAGVSYGRPLSVPETTGGVDGSQPSRSVVVTANPDTEHFIEQILVKLGDALRQADFATSEADHVRKSYNVSLTRNNELRDRIDTLHRGHSDTLLGVRHDAENREAALQKQIKALQTESRQFEVVGLTMRHGSTLPVMSVASADGKTRVEVDLRGYRRVKPR